MPASCLVAFLACAVLQAQEERGIEGLVAELGADDPARREAAQERIERLGIDDDTGDVERRLRQAAEGEDPEIAARCLGLLESIRCWERFVLVPGESGGAIDVLRGRWAWRAHGWKAAWIDPPERGARAFAVDSEGTLHCLDLRNGKVLWDSDTPAHTWTRLPGRCVGRRRGEIVAVSSVTGRPAWKTSFTGDPAIEWQYSIRGGRDYVYLVLPGGVAVFRGKDGAFLWQDATESEPLAADDQCTLFLGTGDRDHRRSVVARSLESGEESWRVELPGLGPTMISALGSVVLVSEACGEPTTALDSSTGAVRWSIDLSAGGCRLDPEGARVWMFDGGRYTIGSVDLHTGETLSGEGRLHAWVKGFLFDDERAFAVFDYDSWGAKWGWVVACSRSSGATIWSRCVQSGRADIEGRDEDAVVGRFGSHLSVVAEESGRLHVRILDAGNGQVISEATLDR